VFFFSSRRRHTRFKCDWSSDVCSSDLKMKEGLIYSPKQLHDDAKAVADAYGRGGYVDLVILPQGTPAGTGLIDVHYKIEEGNRRSEERRVGKEGRVWGWTDVDRVKR